MPSQAARKIEMVHICEENKTGLDIWRDSIGWILSDTGLIITHCPWCGQELEKTVGAQLTANLSSDDSEHG